MRDIFVQHDSVQHLKNRLLDRLLDKFFSPLTGSVFKCQIYLTVFNLSAGDLLNFGKSFDVNFSAAIFFDVDCSDRLDRHFGRHFHPSANFFVNFGQF